MPTDQRHGADNGQGQPQANPTAPSATANGQSNAKGTPATQQHTSQSPPEGHALPPVPSATHGGEGGGPKLTDTLSRSDLSHIERGILTQRIVLTTEQRKALGDEVSRLALTGNSARLRLAAAKVWAVLDGLNLRAEVAAAEAGRGGSGPTVNVNVSVESGPLARLRQVQAQLEQGETGQGPRPVSPESSPPDPPVS